MFKYIILTFKVANTAHIMKKRISFLISFWTPDLAPFITLVSDMKATKSMPNFSKDDFRALNKLLAVPIFIYNWHVQKLVRISPISGSRTLTRIIHDLSLASLDSSIIIEQGFPRLFINFFVKWGARASVTIEAHFVQAQENFMAI